MSAKEGESMESLRKKLMELNKFKDTLQQEIAGNAAAVAGLEQEAQQMAQEHEELGKRCQEKTERINRLNRVLQDAETALKVLQGSTKKLEGVIDKELASLKQKT